MIVSNGSKGHYTSLWTHLVGVLSTPVVICCLEIIVYVVIVVPVNLNCTHL